MKRATASLLITTCVALVALPLTPHLPLHLRGEGEHHASPLPRTGRGVGGEGTTVRGTVVDLSVTPGRPVAGIRVTLRSWHNGRMSGSVQGRTDARGRFTLTAPLLSSSETYTAMAIYKGVSYDLAIPTVPKCFHGERAAPSAEGVTRGSGSAGVPPATDSGRDARAPAVGGSPSCTTVLAAFSTHPLRLGVYDTTASDAGLAAMSVVIGLRRRSHHLAVIEQWTFVNIGLNRLLTDVGADRVSGRGAATFPLPPGASHVVIRDVGPAPATAMAQHGAIVVNTIVRPQTGLNAASFHHVQFTFDVTDSASHPTLLIPTRYFIGSLNIFTDGSRLVAPGFRQSLLAVGSRHIPALVTTSVPGGTALAIGVDGPPAVAAVPSAPAALTAPTPFPIAPVAVMIEVGFASLLLFGLRGRPSASARSRNLLALQRERAHLIGAIAALDAEHARGRVEESAYRSQRAGEKGRLLDVARQLGE